jgi:tetratricopeptide (TPR) repeat protein
MLGNFQLAESYYERILSNYGQTEYHQATVLASVALGNVYLQQGKLAQAEQAFIKSQQYFKELDDLMGVVYSIERLASVAVRRRDLGKAVRLYAWADGMRQGSRPPAEQEDVERDTAAIREMIGEEAYTTAYSEGQDMTMEQAVAYAVEE